jgi:predicted amidophosphoribosyltransferase
MLGALLKLLFPERCVHCDSDFGDEGSDGICRECEKGLVYFPEFPHLVRIAFPLSDEVAKGTLK